MAARRLHERRHRSASATTLVEGPHAVQLALACRIPVPELFVTEAFAAADPALPAAAADTGATVRRVSEPVLARLAQTRTPQGIVAVVDIPSVSLDAVLAAGPGLVAALVECADPGNLGTVVRTADAAGADAVIVTGGSADPWSGKAIRASAGSMFALPVVAGQDPGQLPERLRAAGLAVLVADGAGPDSLGDLFGGDALRRPTAWVFGNEARGLPDAVVRAADARVAIPMRGRAESLNLAAAAAVCLFASAYVRRRTSRG